MSKIRSLLVGAALIIATATSAQAFTVNTVDGTINNVGFIQFAAGSGLAVGANPYGPSGSSNPFMFLYQSYASGLFDANSQQLSSPFPNYEITAVARAWETATGLGTSGATFSLANGTSSNIVDLYYQVGRNANVAAGTGFTDGIHILSANITSLTGVFNQQDTGGVPGFYDNQDMGQGSTQLTATVTYVNPLYLLDFYGVGQNIGLFFEAYTNTPPTGVNTVAMWDGTTPDYYNGTTNTPFNTNDIMMATQGRLSAPVPEPGTLLLLGAGLTGLAIVAKRRSKK